VTSVWLHFRGCLYLSTSVGDNSLLSYVCHTICFAELDVIVYQHRGTYGIVTVVRDGVAPARDNTNFGVVRDGVAPACDHTFCVIPYVLLN
jgi:hypothetical protein